MSKLKNPFNIPSTTINNNNFYESKYFNEQEANFFKQNGQSFDDWQKQQANLDHKQTIFGKLFNGVFGTLMIPVNSIEGIIGGVGKNIRESIEGKEPDDVLKTTWDYIKTGYGNSSNNGFRMWEDITGKYNTMDKMSGFWKFAIGLGTDIVTTFGLGAALDTAKGAEFAKNISTKIQNQMS